LSNNKQLRVAAALNTDSMNVSIFYWPLSAQKLSLGVVIITELMPHRADSALDRIELFNSTEAVVNLIGC
jgi:hypothetical protein